MADRYAIAPNGVFPTVQGEGAMLGVPTLFVRLAGCSVGCAGCDIDYRDKQGRRRGAWYATGEYRVCAEQPDDETLRDTAKWRAWCVEQNNRKEVEAP